MVMPDLPDFITQDGKQINGRVQYNQYCKEHGITNPSDFKEQWSKAAAEREKIFSPGAGGDSERRREALARNYKEFRTYGEYRQMIDNMGRKR